MQFRPAALSAAALLLSSQASAAELLRNLGGPAGFGDEVLFDGEPTSDDGSSAALNITTATGPSGLCYFDSDFTTLFVNNNGNVTFNGPVGSFTPDPFPIADQPMIAPFWADVDTRGSLGEEPPLRNRVYFFQEPGRIVVTWHDVGYFGSRVDKLNDFQLEIANLRDKNNYDITYRYNRVDWTTGDASGGRGGLGGTPAQVGFDAGDGVRFVQLATSRTAAIVDIDGQSNVEPAEPGVFRFELRGCSLPVCGDGNVDSGEQCDDGNIRNGDGCNEFCVRDTDNDGLTDDEEDLLGTDARNPDTDGDGFFDRGETGDVQSPNDVDEDGVIDPLDPDSTSGGRSVFVVNSLDDVDDGRCDEHCSLTDAVKAAASSGDVVLRFRLPAGSTLPLTTVVPFAADNLVIDGSDTPGLRLISGGEGGTLALNATTSLLVRGVTFETRGSPVLLLSGEADAVVDGCAFLGGGASARGLLVEGIDGLLVNDCSFDGFFGDTALAVAANDVELAGVVVSGSGFNEEGEIPAALVRAGLRLFVSDSLFLDNSATGLRVESLFGRDLFVSVRDSSFGVEDGVDVAGNFGLGLDVQAGGRLAVADTVFAGNFLGALATGGNVNLNRVGFDADLDGSALVVPRERDAGIALAAQSAILNDVTILAGRIDVADLTAVDSDFGIDGNDVVTGFDGPGIAASSVSLTNCRVAGASDAGVIARDLTIRSTRLIDNFVGVVAGGGAAEGEGEGEGHADVDALTIEGTNADEGTALVLRGLDDESRLVGITVRGGFHGVDVVDGSAAVAGLDVQGVSVGVSVFAGARVSLGDGVVLAGSDGAGDGIVVEEGELDSQASICGFARGVVVRDGSVAVGNAGRDQDGARCDLGVAIDASSSGSVFLGGAIGGDVVVHDGSVNLGAARDDESGDAAVVDGVVVIRDAFVDGSVELDVRGFVVSGSTVFLDGAVFAHDGDGDAIVVSASNGTLPSLRAERAARRCVVLDDYDPNVLLRRVGELDPSDGPFIGVDVSECGGAGVEVSGIGHVIAGTVRDGRGDGSVLRATSAVVADVSGNAGAGVVVAANGIDVEVQGGVAGNGTGIACLGGTLTAPTAVRGNTVGVDVRGGCVADLFDVVIAENDIGARISELGARGTAAVSPTLLLGENGPAVVERNGAPVVVEGGTFVLGDSVSFFGNAGLAVDRGGDGRSQNTGAVTDAPVIARVTSDGVLSTIDGFAPAGVTLRFWTVDLTGGEPQPASLLLVREEGGAFDLDAGVGDYSDPVLGSVAAVPRFRFRVPTTLVPGLLIATADSPVGTSEPGNAFSLDPCLPSRAAPTCDRDQDGLTNEEERARGTNELLADSDGDHISDADEGTGDADGDGVIDANDSDLEDNDGDGLAGVSDGDDRDPCFPDSGVGSCDRDRDGLTNAEEEALGTSSDLADSDEDGISDGAEARFDTDNDGINNGLESNDTDFDGDGEADDVDPIELPPECAVDGQTSRETVVLDSAEDVAAFEASGIACVVGYLIIGDDVGPVELTRLEVVTGRVIVRESFGETVTLSALSRAGSLEIEDNTVLTTLTLPVLGLIDTDLRIVGNDVLVNLDIRALRRVGGSVIITDNGALATLSLPGLEEIGGDFEVSDNDALETLELNDLVQIEGDLVISDNDALEVLTLPTLSNVGGDLVVEGNDALPSLDLPELDTVGGDLVIDDNDGLDAVNAPDLDTVGGDLVIEENDGLSDVSLPDLTAVGGDLVVDPIEEGGSVDVGGLDEVGGAVRIDSDATVAIPPGWVCDAGGACAEPCGDGVVSNDEDCDDGDGDDGDGCSAQCKVEPGFLCAAGEGGASLCLPVGALVNDDPPPADDVGCAQTSKATSLSLVALLLLLRRRRR